MWRIGYGAVRMTPESYRLIPLGRDSNIRKFEAHNADVML